VGSRSQRFAVSDRKLCLRPCQLDLGTQARDTDHAISCVAWRWLVVPLSEALEVARVLAPAGAITAALVQTGRIILERVRGRNRIAEIQAEGAVEIAKIEATSRAEIAKLQVELQLERERNRTLTSSTLSIGPPPG
jgi:hypothetical protein